MATQRQSSSKHYSTHKPSSSACEKPKSEESKRVDECKSVERIFTEEDEILLLKAVIDFKQNKGSDSRFKRRAMKGQIGEEEYESSGVCSPCKSGRLRFWGKERLNLCASLESES
ncbi:hypothetical protein ACET3Z_013476 [Daucus carota]